MPRIARSEVVAPKQLSAEALEQLIDSMHAVHCQVFTSMEREAFARFIVKPRADHTWVLLHRNEEGVLVGYFALHVFERELDGQPAAVFRVQAGTLRAYRGGNANIFFALQRGLAYRLANPGKRLYYLGAILHPSAYSVLAKHFPVVHPSPGTETSPEMMAFIERLATEIGLERVDPSRPLIRKLAFWTRESEAERSYWRRCDKPAARFFVEQNPGYGRATS